MAEEKTAAAPAKEQKALVSEKDQIAASGIVEVAASIDAITKQMQTFDQLKSQLLGENDFQGISGKNFVKKSGWRKLALAFNISDEVVSEERKTYKTPTGYYFVFEVTAKAIAPNGRFSTATASCASNERKFAHLDHDVRATAHTRAKNRAISDLIGGGEVSAEEIVAESGFAPKARPVSASQRPPAEAEIFDEAPIVDQDDIDFSNENEVFAPEEEKPNWRAESGDACESCKTNIKSKKVVDFSMDRYGKKLCFDCQKTAK